MTTPPEVTLVSEPPASFVDVRNLQVSFATEDGVVRAVDGVSFTLERGKTLGIVGESGSGKSVTSQAFLGLHQGSSVTVRGEIWVDGTDLLVLDEEAMRAVRGDLVAMIFQDPLSSLHPFFTVGAQIVEAYRVHNDVTKAVARKRAIEMLDLVGIPFPERRFHDYPHAFSGGMRQRAMIAMALVCNPKLLIADEPTTALDVTVQAQILALIEELQKEFNSAVMIITHDLGVVAEMADDVVVMYGGRCVEQGSVQDVFEAAAMPYTWGLLGSMPRTDQTRRERLISIPGSPPSLINLPDGCVFNPRCRYQDHAAGSCTTERPELTWVGEGHLARCHIPARVRRTLWTDEIRPAL